jgi:hypothetical protein
MDAGIPTTQRHCHLKGLTSRLRLAVPLIQECYLLVCFFVVAALIFVPDQLITDHQDAVPQFLASQYDISSGAFAYSGFQPTCAS